MTCEQNFIFFHWFGVAYFREINWVLILINMGQGCAENKSFTKLRALGKIQDGKQNKFRIFYWKFI